MIKVALLGDSIRRIGYGTAVPQLLGEDYSVFQPNENCRFAKYTLRGIFEWRAGLEGYDIVHWNNGLWDVCDLYGDGPFSTHDEYLTNMLHIAKLLTKNHKKVIFATTTPVRPEHQYSKNETISEYNALVVPHLVEMGIEINDLNATVSKDINKYIRETDNIHLTEEGIKVCAEQVASFIRDVAEKSLII